MHVFVVLICAKVVYPKLSQFGSFIQAFNSLVKGNFNSLPRRTHKHPLRPNSYLPLIPPFREGTTEKCF